MQHLAHCFPVRIEFVFERNTSCESEFSRWRKALFFPKGIFDQIEETCVSLKRKPCVLQPGASTTLFSCENCVSFLKKIFLQFTIFKEGKAHFVPKGLFRYIEEKLYLLKKTIRLRSMNISHMVFQRELC